MNCFEWQNRSAEYIDGTLMASQRREADEHLDQCNACQTKHSHYLALLSQIASQPRSALPIPIRKAPLSISLPRLDIKHTKSRWQDTPWFIRTGLEGLAIATFILLVIGTVPKIRLLYERNVERRLEAFTLAEINTEKELNEAIPLGAPSTREKDQETSEDAGEVDDFSTGHESGEEDTESKTASGKSESKIKVGNSEIWRFNLKTDSPQQIRPKIVKILTDLKIPSDTPGIGGIIAPGGIQFDLFIPQNIISELKQSLQNLTASSQQTDTVRESHSLPDENFTWYKNKSKRPVPSGKARVVIWLSQM